VRESSFKKAFSQKYIKEEDVRQNFIEYFIISKLFFQLIFLSQSDGFFPKVFRNKKEKERK